ANRFLLGAEARIDLEALRGATSLGGRLPELAGRSVLIATHDQLATAVALIELDGVARRVTLCPPDLALSHLPAVAADAGIDAIVSDRPDLLNGALDVALRVSPDCGLSATRGDRPEQLLTQWVLLTSGTTGAPKMLQHTLAGLAGAIATTNNVGTVWGTFYDMRRYGGLQIFFRSMLGGGSFVLSSVDEPIGDYLLRLGRHGATHVLGTPSHWRRALMSPSARAIAPHYVRLSGEIADQAILDSLRTFYPDARITHAFASTESGVGFEVTDGLEGFPPSVLGRHGEVEIKVVDGSLRFRSARTASRYLGDARALMDADGFVDTGDMVELRAGRYYFLGRKSGVVNVGGLKVHPEEVEAVINRHPAVRMSVVRSRRSPITGAIVVAEVVLTPADAGDDADVRNARCRAEILRLCSEGLPPHKVPALIRVVPGLGVAPAGKIARHDPLQSPDECK
ncbi:MAG TPA: fatty acid--CoA ligase family protein, partial [Xanthobacteraceae bacterium]|nr:fatty acid--CoA ligase family protein [Xanthobacteraceae bacterium]